MKKHLGLVALLLCSAIGQAQDLRIGLRGEQLSRPGLQAALEMPYGGQSSSFTTYWGPRLSTYAHPHNHVAIMPGLEHGLKFTHSNGFFAGINLHFSLYRSFYRGQTYRMLADGQLHRVFLGGQWGWAPGIDLQLGYAMNHRLQVLAGASYYQQRPYNYTYRHGWAVEAGIKTSLKHQP